MIVDCHTHIWRYPGQIGEEFAMQVTSRGKPALTTQDLDVPPERHWQAVEGVDKAIVLGFKSRHLGVNVPNEFVSDYVREHPEKLIGFMGIDPTDPDVIQEMEYCAKELSLKGIKISPLYQSFDPVDPKYAEFFERAQKLNLPILMHQAAAFPRRGPLRWANPILIDEIAMRYPDLVIILAHMGNPWQAETAQVIRKHPNVYADVTAEWHFSFDFYRHILLYYQWDVCDKLLFGTDFPFTTLKDAIRGILQVNDLIEGTRFPRIPIEVVREIVYSNPLPKLGLD